MGRRPAIWILTSIALLAAGAGAQEAPARKKARKAPAPAENEAKPSHGYDRASLEAYLKERQAKVKVMHKGRMDFMAEENRVWENFWNDLRDKRNLFEVRIARQRLDLFETLSSLDPKDHSSTIYDFEKLQSNVTKQFEVNQKLRMQEFFVQREQRWREFTLQQEKERQDYAGEAEAAWQAQKAALKEK